MGARGRPSSASLAIVPVQTETALRPSGAPPEPPKHLSKEASAWWRSVVRDYDMEAHHLHLLEAACGAWERMVQARKEIASRGITFAAANGDLKANPAVAIERDARMAFARLVRELDLDAEGPADRSRPPAIGSNRRGG
jgi:P27 family predicted phage terminase small subunit